VNIVNSGIVQVYGAQHSACTGWCHCECFYLLSTVILLPWHACLQGCNTFTFSPSVMQELCCVQETEAAAADFEAAAQRSQHSPSSR